MATAPFLFDESIPEDDDIVSQFPAAERTFRDQVEDFLLVDHNTYGRHAKVSLDVTGSAPTIASSIVGMWADTDGTLLARLGSGNTFYVGPPAGTVLEYYGTVLPEGYAWANGGVVSRTGVGARLFAALSTTFGVGDGSTTFNVPDKRGRVGVGKDTMGGVAAAARMTSAGSGVDGATLGAVGGTETHTLTLAQEAAHDHGGSTGSEGAHRHFGWNADTPFESGAGGTDITALIQASFWGHHAGSGSIAYVMVGTATEATLGRTSPGSSHLHSIASAGGGGAHNNTQPSIVCNFIIKL